MAEGRPEQERGALGTGWFLLVWAALIVGLNGFAWVSGLRTRMLSEAVEYGTARVETRTKGEVSEDSILKAIRLQRDTLRFWRTLALIGDFGVEPLAPALRALAVTVVLSALAALMGRSVGFADAWADNARLQGFWVAGLAVALVLVMLLNRIDIETSAVLVLPTGHYPAALWLGLRQVEVFVVLGWLATAWRGWRRGQANLVVAVVACLMLATVEAALRVAVALVLGAGMRLTIIPE